MQATTEEEIKELLRTDRMEIDEDEEDNQRLMPQREDPKLFRVRVREGFEREMALNLMNKFLALRDQPEQILIYSASALDRYKGFIFIEADNKAHVLHALKGFLYVQVDSSVLIEIHEMPDIFKPDPTREVNIEEDQWVRIKGGLYDGDIGRVVTFNENKTKITVKLVPRLGSAEDEENEEEEEAPKGRADHLRRYHERKKKNIRPPQRLFDPKEVKSSPSSLCLISPSISTQRFPTVEIKRGNITTCTNHNTSMVVSWSRLLPPKTLRLVTLHQIMRKVTCSFKERSKTLMVVPKKRLVLWKRL